MTVTRFSMGFRVTYEDDSAIGDGVYRDWIVKIMRRILNSRELFEVNDAGKYQPLLDSKFDL
ncbi:MAG: hypothetical protein EBZ77_12580, partial [Chitinophagia bacterium]|nr:hypothetical protein [Chitinophagia bacterium]